MGWQELVAEGGLSVDGAAEGLLTVADDCPGEEGEEVCAVAD